MVGAFSAARSAAHAMHPELTRSGLCPKIMLNPGFLAIFAGSIFACFVFMLDYSFIILIKFRRSIAGAAGSRARAKT